MKKNKFIVFLNFDADYIDSKTVGSGDLMLLKMKRRNRPYRILQNGQKICYYLNQLANRYDYRKCR